MSGLISVSDALAHIQANRPLAEAETVPIEHAYGRRLIESVMALRTHPPAAMSAMDGYAVRLDDVREENAQLKVIGEAPAGSPFDGTVGCGEAVRLFTGSVIPDGADTVIIQENVARDGDAITSLKAYKAPAHVRAAGLDFSKGDVLINDDGRIVYTPFDDYEGTDTFYYWVTDDNGHFTRATVTVDVFDII